MKKIILLGFVFVISLSTVFGSCVTPLLAENSETKIFVDPINSTANLGESLDIKINIQDAVNVYCWQFGLNWDPTILEHACMPSERPTSRIKRFSRKIPC